MHRNAILCLATFVLSAMTPAFIPGCAKERPDAPRRLNPLDPDTEVLDGNPFHLTADLVENCVSLAWVHPGISSIAGWGILRSLDAGWTDPDTLALPALEVRTYLDTQVEPGGRYFYKVLARDADGDFCASSHLASVSMETMPVLLIEGGAALALSRRVSLTLQASDADSMRLANDADFTGRAWEPFRTPVSDWLLEPGLGTKAVFLQVRHGDRRLSPVVSDSIAPEPIGERRVTSESGTRYFTDAAATLKVVAPGADSVRVWDSAETEPEVWIPFPVDSDTLRIPWTFPRCGKCEGWTILRARYIDDFLNAAGPDTVHLALDLTPPVADLAMTPPDSARHFVLDASGSHDAGDVTPSDELLFSWQWEEGGPWEPWTLQAMTSHTYAVFGPKTLRLAVKDGAGRIDTLASPLTVVNRPPPVPSEPFPAAGAPGQSLVPELTWAPSVDLDGDPVAYTVTFGASPALEDTLVTGLGDTRWPAPILDPGATYYWTITATDTLGAESRSEWSFSTHSPAGDTYTLGASWGGQGSGAGQFEVVRDVVLDGLGRIYATDVGNARVQVFSSSGLYLREIVEAADQAWLSPYGLTTDAEGSLYVVDSGNHRVAKFDSAGQYLWSLGSRGTGPGEFQFPRDVAVDGSGNLYVLDTGNDRVQRFDPGRGFVLEWGARGSADGEFDTPGGITVLGDTVFVADSYNRRVQRFMTDGTFVTAWGGFGAATVPASLAADASGRVHVLTAAGTVLTFDAAGTLLSTWGSSELGSPTDGICAGADGNLVWVADSYAHRVCVFERQ